MNYTQIERKRRTQSATDASASGTGKIMSGQNPYDLTNESMDEENYLN